ncbi:MAG: diphosphate--fructose-6-phosphate 1-phosphotransferase [Planctomycetota bacterium]
MDNLPQFSALQNARMVYRPKLPPALRQPNVRIEQGEPALPYTDQAKLRELFPRTFGQPVVTLAAGKSGLSTAPLKVGVVLSGGPAPGGHNVIAGLFDVLKAANKDSTLIGFLKGPKGIIDNKFRELTADFIAPHRNTGGFNMLMSGRDKIEKPADLAGCEETVKGLDGLVIVGGDDSNTNAAVLAEHLMAKRLKTRVIGVPKTIDGDMKNREIETSFGFDSACKTYAELIGNICRDAQSSVKYWHFIRLMGRAASHITLECALQTHPNVALISEEVQAQELTLSAIVDRLVDTILKRDHAGKKYGIALVPEGLPEFIPEIRGLIHELGRILGEDEHAGMLHLASLHSHEERVHYLSKRLTDHSARVYGQLPTAIQEVLLKPDSHGNIPLSQVETERLLIDLVSEKIGDLHPDKKISDLFNPLSHFLGYEGRCGAPSNFDADYGYTLGCTAGQLIRAGLTSYTAHVRNLAQPAEQWIAGGTPITALMNLEMRGGRAKPVVRKSLVDLHGRPFKTFAAQRDTWAREDAYAFPGPVQYYGSPEVCDATTLTLQLEWDSAHPRGK